MEQREIVATMGLATVATVDQEGVEEVPQALTGSVERLARTYGSQRLLLLQGLMYKAYRAAGMTPLTGEVLVQTLETWAETLIPIPSEQLYEYYLLALHSRRRGYAVAAQDIIVCWNIAKDEEEAGGRLWQEPEAYKRAQWQALAESSRRPAEAEPRREDGHEVTEEAKA